MVSKGCGHGNKYVCKSRKLRFRLGSCFHSVCDKRAEQQQQEQQPQWQQQQRPQLSTRNRNSYFVARKAQAMALATHGHATEIT